MTISALDGRCPRPVTARARTYWSFQRQPRHRFVPNTPSGCVHTDTSTSLSTRERRAGYSKHEFACIPIEAVHTDASFVRVTCKLHSYEQFLCRSCFRQPVWVSNNYLLTSTQRGWGYDAHLTSTFTLFLGRTYSKVVNDIVDYNTRIVSRHKPVVTFCLSGTVYGCCKWLMSLQYQKCI